VWCRNPLHALSGSANFIKESCKPDDAIYEDVSIIVSGALQMSRLLVSIMDWTKVSVGQLELKQDQFDLSALLLRLV
jgi:signal transduction histidine kinase